MCFYIEGFADKSMSSECITTTDLALHLLKQ